MSDSRESRRLALCQAIREAFAERAPPREDQIVDPPDDPEAMEILEQFRGKRWEAVSSELLFRERALLSFSTPAGFCYYLPAFLIAVLERREWWPEIADNLLFKLVPPSPDAVYAEHWREQVKSLRAQEFRAVRQFLEYVAEHGGDKPWSHGTIAKQALSAFWSRDMGREVTA